MNWDLWFFLLFWIAFQLPGGDCKMYILISLDEEQTFNLPNQKKNIFFISFQWVIEESANEVEIGT